MLDAPDRELIGIGRRAGVGRVPFAALDGELVFDLLLVLVIEADAEDVRRRHLVDAVVEPAENRVEVERRGDFAPHVAQELDLLFPLPLTRRYCFGGLGSKACLVELCAGALLTQHTAALQPLDAKDCQAKEGGIAEISPPGPIPGRQNGERVSGLIAHLAEDVARADPEAVVTESQVGEIPARLVGPRRPVTVHPVEPALVHGRRFIGEGGGREFEAERVVRAREPRRRHHSAARVQPAILIGRDLAHERRERNCRGLRGASQVDTDQCVIRGQPHDPVGFDERERAVLDAESRQR